MVVLLILKGERGERIHDAVETAHRWKDAACAPLDDSLVNQSGFSVDREQEHSPLVFCGKCGIKEDKHFSATN